MKWLKGAKDSIVVVGEQGQGNISKQLSRPQRLIVNEVESKEGCVVGGGNGEGERSNQFCYPKGSSFDVESNLYVVDSFSNRIQCSDVDKN